MELLGTLFTYLLIGSIIYFLVIRNKNKKEHLSNYKQRKSIALGMIIISLVFTIIFGILSNDDDSNQTNQSTEIHTKSSKVTNKKKEFDYSLYKDFSNQFPNALNNYSNNDLSAKNVKYTGSIYGLSADSNHGYMVICKDKNNHLAFLNFNSKLTGKLTIYNKLTIYGATNGKGKISESYIKIFSDLDDNQINEKDLNKETVLISPNKIIVDK